MNIKEKILEINKILNIKDICEELGIQKSNLYSEKISKDKEELLRFTIESSLLECLKVIQK